MDFNLHNLLIGCSAVGVLAGIGFIIYYFILKGRLQNNITTITSVWGGIKFAAEHLKGEKQDEALKALSPLAIASIEAETRVENKLVLGIAIIFVSLIILLLTLVQK